MITRAYQLNCFDTFSFKKKLWKIGAALGIQVKATALSFSISIPCPSPLSFCFPSRLLLCVPFEPAHISSPTLTTLQLTLQLD